MRLLLAILVISTIGGTQASAAQTGHSTPAEVLFRVLQTESHEHLQRLAEISDAGPSIAARYFFTPAHQRAAARLMAWMQEAGMRTWIDDIGNVHGRIDSLNPNEPAMLFGSHYDTVYDGGKYDGAMGIVTAIAAIKAVVIEASVQSGLLEADVLSSLHRRGRELDLNRLLGDKVNALFKQPCEVIGFSDEEGVRFQSTFLGSSALAGTLLSSGALKSKDKDGRTVLQVLRDNKFPGTEESIAAVAVDASEVAGYVEVHIEQGPVLEAMGRPLAVVDAIIGQTRLHVEMVGEQGHAGTVPMNMRHDPMAGAAHVIHGIEDLCTGQVQEVAVEASTVCTVGSLLVWPGTSNVIPGSVNFTIDIRTSTDTIREVISEKVRALVNLACQQRGLSCNVVAKHQAETVRCANDIVVELSLALEQAEQIGHRLQRVATCIEERAEEDCNSYAIPVPRALKAASEGDSCAASEGAAAEGDTGVEGESCPASGSRSGSNAGYAQANNDKAGGGPNGIPVLTSGAGHDALALAHLTKVGMVFVRCRGGVSHSPLEHVEEADLGYASSALFAYVRAKLLASSP